MPLQPVGETIDKARSHYLAFGLVNHLIIQGSRHWQPYTKLLIDNSATEWLGYDQNEGGGEP